MIYFIDNILTIGKDKDANNFFKVCVEEISKYNEVVKIKSMMILKKSFSTFNKLDKNDSIIFFNRDDQEYDKKIIELLSNSEKIQVEIYPIAIKKEHRFPPKCIEKVQSFDIVEQLRQRKLDSINIETVAKVLARIVIAKSEPTLCNEKMKCFISHRRIDGEVIAAKFSEALTTSTENTFRDLGDLKVGDDAQVIIEKHLRLSDVLLFLHTPKSGESEMIEKELKIALSCNIPIVWIKIGEADENKLKIKPAAKPHFIYDELDAEKDQIPKEAISDIIDMSFRIIMENASVAFDKIREIRLMLENNKDKINPINKKNMIYELLMERKGYVYHQRKMRYIIQCYSRVTNGNDFNRLSDILNKFKYTDYQMHEPYYDSVFLLSTRCKESNCLKEDVYNEDFEKFIKNLRRHFMKAKLMSKQEKGIIISGAFPNCEPEYQQHLTNAIYALVEAIFNKNGTVIFGAHPTFQELIFSKGKLCRPDSFKDKIRLYASKYFEKYMDIEYLNKNSTAFFTDKIKDSEGEGYARKRSLEIMRKKMIQDERALALVCLGGKSKKDNCIPGIDEEIKLAKERGLPVFLIGSVGGRSSELAAELDMNDWNSGINNLSKEDNRELMLSVDYSVIANKILNNVGL